MWPGLGSKAETVSEIQRSVRQESVLWVSLDDTHDGVEQGVGLSFQMLKGTQLLEEEMRGRVSLSLRAEVGAVPSGSEELILPFHTRLSFEAEPWNTQAGNVIDHSGSHSRLRACPSSLCASVSPLALQMTFKIFAARKMAPKDFLWFVQC